MPETGNLSQHLLSKKELAALCVTSSFYVSGGNRTHITGLGVAVLSGCDVICSVTKSAPVLRCTTVHVLRDVTV